MANKTVYNIADGAETVAYQDQVDAELWHLPAAATWTKPPSFNKETQTCQFIDNAWVVADIPVPEVEEVEEEVLTWSDKRQAEYPSIADLVVALYDTDDKSAIETKRAAVQLQFPAFRYA